MKDPIVNREFDLLELDKNKSKFYNEMKKVELIDQLKTEFGKDLKNEISIPNRHNPKKQSIWKRILKAFNL